jgi:ABC-type bacteriocin/lantibiotic exporter with double-glycine peptidase domain
VELPLADFAQDDPRWGLEHLGPSTDTLADQGCTLTSVAMVLNYYHVRCDPSVLNRFLFHHDGYDDQGLLDFERVVAFAPDKVRLEYQGAPSHEALDREIRAGHPVIVQLILYGGYRHFVVVMGKQGYDYLVRDPAADPAQSLVTLRSLSPRIEQQYLYAPRGR